MTDEAKEMDDLAFEETVTASAVMYAHARRYCLAFEALEIPDQEREMYLSISAVYQLADASARWFDAMERWHTRHEHEGPDDGGEVGPER